MSQGSFTKSGRAVEKDMVKSFTSAFGSGDGYAQIFLNSVLSDEISQAPGPQTGIKRGILGAGLTRYNASYFASPPQ